MIHVRNLFAALLVGGCLLFAQPVSARVSGNVPLNSWVYPALEKLEGLGLIDSAMQGARPFTRLEAARQVREARGKSYAGSSPRVVQELLERLETFFAEELAPGNDSGGYFKPLREFRLEYIHLQGEESTIAGNTVDARQFALNTYNDGVNYREYHNGRLLFESEARFGRRFLLSVRPQILLQEGSGGNFQILHGKAAVGLGPVEFSAGRQSLWWGQGRHGALVLTNNAKPLDMIRITNPQPVLLPWVLNYLGPFRFDVFWSQLERDRVISRPFFAGLRVQIKPLPWLELGASRTIQFGGKGVPSINFSEFITILGGRNREGDEDTSNSLAALDARLRLPFLWGAELYGEYGGEDEAGHFFTLKAWIAGLHLPRIEPSGRLSLRLEHADLTVQRGTTAVWYRHSVYRSGYTHEGNIMGHRVGGGAKDTSAELRMLLPEGVSLSLTAAFERRGYDQDVLEKHTQGILAAEWQMNDHLSLLLRYGVDRVRNFEFSSGNDKTHHMASVGFSGAW